MEAHESENPLNFESVRAAWIAKQLKLREASFTKTFDITVFHATWNVNMAKATTEIWPIFASCANPPDIVSFGMQELDMTTESLLRGETSRAAPWIEHTLNQLNYAATAIKERNRAKELVAMGGAAAAAQNAKATGASAASSDPFSAFVSSPAPGPHHPASSPSPTSGGSSASGTNSRLPEIDSVYECLGSKQMVGILLTVYVLKKHRPAVSEVSIEIMATGILGVMGNKGAVATRFRFHDSTFCILNAHFNAHQQNVARRNQDYRDICTILFNIPEVGPMTIFDHDNIFWMGDLNYRIDLTDEVVREKIKLQQWDYLWQADQLNIHMKRGNVFTGFQEAPIAFAPTYKYVCGSPEYDTEKARIPAWCDRVLWKSSDKVLNLSYRRHELLQSDHRPVSALFQVPVKAVVKEAKTAVLSELLQELDRKENDTIPDASISTSEVNFGDVRFGVTSTRTFVLENTGKVLCRWKFIPKWNDTKPYKEWLHIQPNMGMLMPGERVTIALTVIISEAVAPKFNMTDEKLDDILILHLLRGKDHFLTVTGQYLPSAFGNRLDNLVRLTQPARLKSPLPESEKARWLRIPKELWRLVDWLFKNALDTEDLFLESGDSFEMEQLREALDTGAELPKVLPHSVGETLLRLLESLEIPIIPFTFYRNVLEVQSAVMAKQLVAKLPDIHYNAFFYIVSFLREVLSHKEKNKLTVEKLGVVFSTVLIRPPKGVKQSEQAHKQQAACIEYFLHSEELTLNLPTAAPAAPSAPSTSSGPSSSSSTSSTASSSTSSQTKTSSPILGGSRQQASSTSGVSSPPQQIPSTSNSRSASAATPSSGSGWRSSTPTQ
jgi:phosphatidylinositol-bisphosphatase